MNISRQRSLFILLAFVVSFGSLAVSSGSRAIAETAPATCTLDCARVRYVPYIINPNGSVRTATNDQYAQSFMTPEGLEVVRFEDSNIDNDYRDVELLIDNRNCEQLTVTVQIVRALWHHKIGVTIYYDTTIIGDMLLWTDSHQAVGQTKTVLLRDAELFSYYCASPPAVATAPPITGGQCTDFDCNAAGLYMYIVNPDGSERHTQSIYAQTHRKGPRQFDIYYDDSGSDFDYNDVMLQIDARDCRAMKVSVLNVLASWHHQIRARIIYNNVILNDILIWPDSHESIGQSATYDILDYIPACMAN